MDKVLKLSDFCTLIWAQPLLPAVQDGDMMSHSLHCSHVSNVVSARLCRQAAAESNRSWPPCHYSRTPYSSCRQFRRRFQHRRPHRQRTCSTVAMVNIDTSPALVLGAGLIGAGVLLYQLRSSKPYITKDVDIVLSSVSIFAGGILVFQVSTLSLLYRSWWPATYSPHLVITQTWCCLALSSFAVRVLGSHISRDRG